MKGFGEKHQIPNKKNSDINAKNIKEQIINKALQYHSKGNIQEAKKYYENFINRGFLNHIVFSNYGVILRDLRKLQEAELFTLKAIQLKPDFAIAYANLTGILRDLGKLQEAESSARKAIQLKPNDALAHNNLGSILRHLGKLQEAELLQRKAIKLKPNFAKANKSLGLILLEKNEFESSLLYFLKSAKLLSYQKETQSSSKRFNTISKAKIEHDIEQYEYLASKKYNLKKFIDLAKLYKKISSEIDWPSDTKLISLSNKHRSLLKDSYNRLIHLSEAPKLKENAVNDELNVANITNDYFNHEFGLTYIDNFLTPQAIKSLRDFLLESTIWFNVKRNGYVGAFLGEGFANPLIIQIADELRKKFPKIFKSYPINQMWAFKYDSRSKNKNSSLKGINVHADFAAINVNFWITPKEANLNPKSGGLIVYDVEAPKQWDFNTLNNDEKRIREELKKSKGNTKLIPYNENRAVIFNSNLFHETDSYEFKEGYENRRINVTLLFGRRND